MCMSRPFFTIINKEMHDLKMNLEPMQLYIVSVDMLLKLVQLENIKKKLWIGATFDNTMPVCCFPQFYSLNLTL